MSTWTARHADGEPCPRATDTRDCDRNHDYDVALTNDYADAREAIIAAEHAQHPVTIETDEGVATYTAGEALEVYDRLAPGEGFLVARCARCEAQADDPHTWMPIRVVDD